MLVTDGFCSKENYGTSINDILFIDKNNLKTLNGFETEIKINKTSKYCKNKLIEIIKLYELNEYILKKDNVTLFLPEKCKD